MILCALDEFRDYYNEVDPYAADWLRNLIAEGVLPAGDVDTRDIRDVRPADLDGYRRCHFFAGIGVWAKALDLAGWHPTQRVWTGSCPCQPFSAAGQGLGFDDERHLWPDWHWLIEQCRPEAVLGEQVASSDGLEWADLVSADMEATGYAFGIVDTCAAGFRSFHIRQRLYFAALDLVSAADARAARDAAIRRFGGLVNALDARLEGHGRHGADRHEPGRIGAQSNGPVAEAGAALGLADADGRDARAERQQPGGQQRLQPQGGGRGERLADADGAGHARMLCRNSAATAESAERQGRAKQRSDVSFRRGQDHDGCRVLRGDGLSGLDVWTDPSDGYWRDADWLWCRDGVWRPVGPGSFPLAHAAPARLGRLRAYGNALDLAQATGFVRAVLERDVGSGHAADLFEWGA